MNKRNLHHLWTRLREVRYAYLIVFFLFSGCIFIWSFKQNNIEMIKLRDSVYAADKEGNGVEQALNDLREHVYSHMNTNLSAGNNSIYPPIQLKFTYERLEKAEKQKTTTANESIYAQAQIKCEKQFPSGLSGSFRIPCIEEYVSMNGVKEKQIPKELYQFDFVSPDWSPDLAGWSLLATIVLAVLIAARFILERWLKSQI